MIVVRYETWSRNICVVYGLQYLIYFALLLLYRALYGITVILIVAYYTNYVAQMGFLNALGPPNVEPLLCFCQFSSPCSLFILIDTFASKVATINDETADGSIGNVTGSNSVNVFLGIGLAWSVAAIYHAANGTKFVVETGSLGFSVMIFCIEAVVCIAILMYRRFNKNIAAELGGPRRSRMITSAALVLLWFMYVLLSAFESYCYINHNL